MDKKWEPEVSREIEEGKNVGAKTIKSWE